MQTKGWRRGTSKQQTAKEDKAAYQLGSIIVQSVPHAKLCADIIRGKTEKIWPNVKQGRSFFSWIKQTAVISKGY